MITLSWVVILVFASILTCVGGWLLVARFWMKQRVIPATTIIELVLALGVLWLLVVVGAEKALNI